MINSWVSHTRETCKIVMFQNKLFRVIAAKAVDALEES